MPHYKFGPNDLLYNQIKSYPQAQFTFYSGSVYYNNVPNISGSFVSSVKSIQPGHISLYELNVDRNPSQRIYPFVTKQGSLTAFNTVTTSDFNTNFLYGDVIQGSYPMSSSVHREYYAANSLRPRLDSLKTALKSYLPISPEYKVTSTSRDLTTGSLNMLCVPSIFYGSQIKKGSLDLRVYITGTLIARAQDINKNGALYQTEPIGSPQSGSAIGTIMYNEGVLLLTSSTDLSAGSHTEIYVPDASATGPAWLHFGSKGTTQNSYLSGTVWDMKFEGTTYTPVVTMFAKAPQGDLNFSNNPTFAEKSNLTSSYSSSLGYFENAGKIKNINSSSYVGYNKSFENVTYISSVGIYDKDKNLIGVAKLANPVRKTEQLDYLFKLKLDI